MSARDSQKLNATHLEQCGNSISRNTPIGIGNEILHVEVARGYSLGVALRQLVERFNGGKLEHGLGGSQEQLEHSDRTEQLGSGDASHIANRTGSLDIDHVGFVSEERLEVLVHLFLHTGWFSIIFH